MYDDEPGNSLQNQLARFFVTLFEHRNQDDFDNYSNSGNGITNMALRKISQKYFILANKEYSKLNDIILSLQLSDRFIDIKTRTEILNYYFEQNKYLIFDIDETIKDYITNNTGYTLKNLERLIFLKFDKIIEDKFEDTLNVINDEDYPFNNLQITLLTFILYISSFNKVQDFISNVSCKYIMNKINNLYKQKKSYTVSIQLHQILYFIVLQKKNNTVEKLIETITKMSEHYLFESTIVKIFLIIAYYFNSDYDYIKLINSLSCTQLFALKQMSNDMYRYLKLEKITDNFIESIKLKDNFTTILKDLNIIPVYHNSIHRSFIETNFLRAKLFIDFNFENKCTENITISNLFQDELLSEDHLWYSFHLTQQGLNEIFEAEQLLENQLNISYNKNDNQRAFKLSKTWCKRVCKRTENLNCTNDKDIPTNIHIQKLIQRCEYQRDEYAKVCVYEKDDGHDQAINDLKKREESCQRIINSMHRKNLLYMYMKSRNI